MKPIYKGSAACNPFLVQCIHPFLCVVVVNCEHTSSWGEQILCFPTPPQEMVFSLPAHIPFLRLPYPQKYILSTYCEELRKGINEGLPTWLSGKEFACQFRRCRFDPWVGKIPWRRERQPTPVFLHGKSHGQRSLGGPCGRKSWTWLGD